LLGALGFWIVFLNGPAAAADGDGAEKVYQRTLRSTVWVVVPRGDRIGSGAGSLVDVPKRLVITNYHLVGERDDVLIFFPIIQKNGDVVAERSTYRKSATGIRGKVVARESKKDLALIQLEALPRDARALFLARESPKTGQRLHSIGNPGTSDALWVYTEGTVRQVYHKQFRTTGKNDEGFEIDARIVETSSPVNAGDSGGPVVNDKGELVAVTQGHLADSQARLVSLAIDVSEVRKILASKGVTKLATLPGTAPDKPRAQATADTAQKPDEDPAEKMEKDAARKLKLAKMLAEDGLVDKARLRYKEIIETYPKTKAADDARQLLEKLKK
jgi:S1-C subfamily serine protease